MSNLNLLIEPDELQEQINNPNLLIVDFCKPAQYAQAHIPGAHAVSYGDIIAIDKPVMGLLPDAAQFSSVLAKLGITADTQIVAYDDEGGGCASRFIWTLNEYGHDKASLLNGGLFSWANESHDLSNEIPETKSSSYEVKPTNRVSVNRDYIMQKLQDKNTALLDARSVAEYTGEKAFAARGGHIPGAIHYEWTDAMDRNNNMRLLPAEQIQTKLNELGLSKDKEIICYCQSHHRSAFSYVMLRTLGYDNVKGYPGSWLDWGNCMDAPIE